MWRTMTTPLVIRDFFSPSVSQSLFLNKTKVEVVKKSNTFQAWIATHISASFDMRKTKSRKEKKKY